MGDYHAEGTMRHGSRHGTVNITDSGLGAASQAGMMHRNMLINLLTLLWIITVYGIFITSDI